MVFTFERKFGGKFEYEKKQLSQRKKQTGKLRDLVNHFDCKENFKYFTFIHVKYRNYIEEKMNANTKNILVLKIIYA